MVFVDAIWTVHEYFLMKFCRTILVDFYLIGCRLIYIVFCFLQISDFIYEIIKTLAQNLGFGMLKFNPSWNSLKNSFVSNCFFYADNFPSPF